MSIVMITHDLGVIAELSKRVAVFYAGRGMEEALTPRYLEIPAPVYGRTLVVFQN